MELKRGRADFSTLLDDTRLHAGKNPRICPARLQQLRQALPGAGIAGGVAKTGLGGKIGKERGLDLLRFSEPRKVVPVQGGGFVVSEPLASAQ